MKSCKFCVELESKKTLHNDTRNYDERIMHKYEVALVIRSFRGATHAGRSTYFGYKLNFCPECGRNIRKELRK